LKARNGHRQCDISRWE